LRCYWKSGGRGVAPGLALSHVGSPTTWTTDPFPPSPPLLSPLRTQPTLLSPASDPHLWLGVCPRRATVTPTSSPNPSPRSGWCVVLVWVACWLGLRVCPGGAGDYSGNPGSYLYTMRCPSTGCPPCGPCPERLPPPPEPRKLHPPIRGGGGWVGCGVFLVCFFLAFSLVFLFFCWFTCFAVRTCHVPSSTLAVALSGIKPMACVPAVCNSAGGALRAWGPSSETQHTTPLRPGRHPSRATFTRFIPFLSNKSSVSTPGVS